MKTAWTEFANGAASTDRGWFKAICAPFDWDRYSEYTSETMPVFDEDLQCWREQSTLGNYLDYGPCRPYAADKPQVHAVCYATREADYFWNVADAKTWIESQALNRRRDLREPIVLAA